MNSLTTGAPFMKASACGNDFLIIDGIHATKNVADLSRRLCDRHEGVGADGVEWLFPAQDADVQARLFNADGSEAEISGNGTRCVAAYWCAEQSRQKVVIRTGAGLKTCVLTAHSGASYEFETAMGEPQVGQEFALRLASGDEVRGTPVSMGNPHFVVFVGDLAPGWKVRGAEIGRHNRFNSGTNVEFVTVSDQANLEVRFYERGVGETRSSGTGACASAAAAIVSKRAESPVTIHAPGGSQIVRWDGELFLRGAARIICRGEFFV